MSRIDICESCFGTVNSCGNFQHAPLCPNDPRNIGKRWAEEGMAKALEKFPPLPPKPDELLALREFVEKCQKDSGKAEAKAEPGSVGEYFLRGQVTLCISVLAEIDRMINARNQSI